MAIHPRSLLTAATLTMILLASAQAAAPAATAYTLDAPRSWIKFAFVQAKAGNQGRFRKFDVALRFDDKNLAACRLEVTVKVDSLDTGDEERDQALRGADLFDVAKFPESKFRATKFNRVSIGRYEALGKLTMRGVTRDVRVPLSFYTASEKSGPAAYLNGSFPLNRLDFGVGQGDFKSTDQVENEVTVKFGLRFTPTPAATP